MKSMCKILQLGLQWVEDNTESQPHWVGMCVVADCMHQEGIITVDELNAFHNWIGPAMASDGNIKNAYLINHLCDQLGGRKKRSQDQLRDMWTQWYENQITKLKKQITK